MGAKITVELVQGAGGVDFGELLSREVEAATVGALNRTVQNVQVEAGREIRQELNLPAGVVKLHLKTRNATRGRQVAEVHVLNKRPGRRFPGVPLYDFAPPSHPLRKPVRVRVKRGRPAVQLRHAFTVRMPSGHVGIFQREEGWSNRKPARGPRRRSGLPIRELFSTSVIDSFHNHLTGLHDFTRERLVANLQRETNFRRLKSRGAAGRRVA